MTTALLKRKISTAIDTINDPGFLKALHTIVQSKKDEMHITLNAAQKKELDKRMENHAAGKSKSYTWTEVRKAAGKK